MLTELPSCTLTFSILESTRDECKHKKKTFDFREF